MGLAHSPRIVTDGLVLALDAGNTKSYPGSGSTWKDLSGNGYDAIQTGSRVSYSSAESAWEFTGTTDTSSDGIYITGLNYVTGSSDAIPNLTVESQIKCNSGATSHSGDQRIILSFDRSAVFRFSIGNDVLNGVAGKPVFGFDATGTVVDISASSYSGDLRDDAWHQVCVTFDSSNVKFYIDGTLVHTSTGSYGSIGSQTESSETPRYGWIGNGSEATSAGSNNSAVPGDLFYGFISKINYYYKTLSDAEIKQNFNAIRGRYGL